MQPRSPENPIDGVNVTIAEETLDEILSIIYQPCTDHVLPENSVDPKEVIRKACSAEEAKRLLGKENYQNFLEKNNTDFFSIKFGENPLKYLQQRVIQEKRRQTEFCKIINLSPTSLTVFLQQNKTSYLELLYPPSRNGDFLNFLRQLGNQKRLMNKKFINQMVLSQYLEKRFGITAYDSYEHLMSLISNFMIFQRDSVDVPPPPDRKRPREVSLSSDESLEIIKKSRSISEAARSLDISTTQLEEILKKKQTSFFEIKFGEDHFNYLSHRIRQEKRSAVSFAELINVNIHTLNTYLFQHHQNYFDLMYGKCENHLFLAELKRYDSLNQFCYDNHYNEKSILEFIHLRFNIKYNDYPSLITQLESKITIPSLSRQSFFAPARALNIPPPQEPTPHPLKVYSEFF